MHTESSSQRLKETRLFAPIVGSLGVVYGDISTSTLYTLKQIFFSSHYALERSAENIIGACSLIFWSLVLVIGIKYTLLIMKADNHGEGGIFALLALIKKGNPFWIMSVILFGAALLFADGMITPAISILAAIEGLQVASPALMRYLNVTWIAAMILCGLFFFQSRGTERIGKIFGPIMIIWLLSLIATGLPPIIKHPEIMEAIYNPLKGFTFLVQHGWHSVFIMGAVVLVITGGEALYADMGHFSARIIRISWFTIVFPSLMINYLGQGAQLLTDNPISAENVFFSLVPKWGLFPMVAIATFATIIASQALITGAYSLTQQGIALGYIPRIKIIHTSDQITGQIYVPLINWVLLVGCLLLVFGFKESTNLAAAYGLAVTGTMAITTLTFYIVATQNWGWDKRLIGPVCVILGLIDLAFFNANLFKFFHGGYVPIVIAIIIWQITMIWHEGRERIATAYASAHRMTVQKLVERVAEKKKTGDVIPRSLVFMCSRPLHAKNERIPAALDAYWDWHSIFPQRILILHVEQLPQPYVNKKERYVIHHFSDEVTSVVVSFGYMEQPDVRRVLAELKERGETAVHKQRWTIIVGKENLAIRRGAPWTLFKAHLFKWMLKIATPAHAYFHLENDAGVLEITQAIDYTRNPPHMVEWR